MYKQSPFKKALEDEEERAQFDRELTDFIEKFTVDIQAGWTRGKVPTALESVGKGMKPYWHLVRDSHLIHYTLLPIYYQAHSREHHLPKSEQSEASRRGGVIAGAMWRAIKSVTAESSNEIKTPQLPEYVDGVRFLGVSEKFTIAPQKAQTASYAEVLAMQLKDLGLGEGKRVYYSTREAALRDQTCLTKVAKILRWNAGMHSDQRPWRSAVRKENDRFYLEVLRLLEPDDRRKR